MEAVPTGNDLLAATENPGNASAVIVPVDGTDNALTMAFSEAPEQTQRPVGDGEDTSTIAGLWQSSSFEVGISSIDYFRISADGIVEELSNQGDSNGAGENCYRSTSYIVASRDSNRYDIDNSSSLPGSRGSEDVMITIEEEQLVLRYFDTEASREGGDFLIPQSTSLAPALNPASIIRC